MDRWSVRRAAADVMQSYGPIGMDKHIAAELIHVVVRSPRHPSARHELEVGAPILQTPHRPEAAAVHFEHPVQRTRRVDQHRPWKSCFFDIRLCTLGCFECNSRNSHFQQINFSLALLQLQQMLSTRQSHQVPVKNQQQPVAGEIRQPYAPARSSGQLEIWGGTSNQEFGNRLLRCLMRHVATARAWDRLHSNATLRYSRGNYLIWTDQTSSGTGFDASENRCLTEGRFLEHVGG